MVPTFQSQTTRAAYQDTVIAGVGVIGVTDLAHIWEVFVHVAIAIVVESIAEFRLRMARFHTLEQCGVLPWIVHIPIRMVRGGQAVDGVSVAELSIIRSSNSAIVSCAHPSQDIVTCVRGPSFHVEIRSIGRSDSGSRNSRQVKTGLKSGIRGTSIGCPGIPRPADSFSRREAPHKDFVVAPVKLPGYGVVAAFVLLTDGPAGFQNSGGPIDSVDIRCGSPRPLNGVEVGVIRDDSVRIKWRASDFFLYDEIEVVCGVEDAVGPAFIRNSVLTIGEIEKVFSVGG